MRSAVHCELDASDSAHDGAYQANTQSRFFISPNKATSRVTLPDARDHVQRGKLRVRRQAAPPAPIDEKASRQRLASHARRLGGDTNGRGATVLRLELSFSNGTTAR